MRVTQGISKDKRSRSVSAAVCLLTALVTLAISVLAPSLGEAAKGQTCKVTTNDIGTIIGHGKDMSAAFEDAATQCFDRHMDASKAHRGPAATADEEAGLVIIDVCANIKCST